MVEVRKRLSRGMIKGSEWRKTKDHNVNLIEIKCLTICCLAAVLKAIVDFNTYSQVPLH